MAFPETQKLTVQLDLAGNLQSKLGSAERAIQGFDKATSNTQRSLGKFGSNIEKGIVVGLGAATAGFVGLVRAASDYESAFAGVRKTVTATDAELTQLSDQFRQLSKEIPISASELARLGEAGGALGVPTDQLKEFVRVTALLGVTTNLTADEAADSLGVLGNVLKLTGAEYSKFASSLVALGNAGASTERDIVSIAERAGAAGKLIGVSTQDLLGFSSAVASLGIESEAGGTALQTFFIDTAKFVSAGGKDLKEIAKVAGTTGKAFQKAFKDDAGAAIQDFLAGLGKLPQAQQLKVLEDLGFNDARITRTLLGLANNTQLVGDQMQVANDAFAQNTALTKEAEQRFNTFDSQLQITKNVLQDMAITIGSKLLPKITPLLKRLNEFVGKNQAGIAKFGDDLAKGFENLATSIQKVDWKPFVDGLRLSADIAKTAIGLFRSLPSELQGLIVGGFALNKITGGLGTSIVKDLGGALLNNFAARGATPANPLFVVDVSGGGAGGIAGAGKGILGTAASLVSKVFVVGLAAEAASLIAGPLQDFGRDIHSTIFGNKGDPFSDFGKAWDAWRKDADWPFGQRNAPEWLGGDRTPTNRIDNVMGNEPLIDRAAERRGAWAPGPAGNVTPQISRLTGEVGNALTAVIKASWAFRTEWKKTLDLATGARSGNQIRAAIASIEKFIFKEGHGGSKVSQVLADRLRADLKHVHDPVLRAALTAEIKKLEAKTAGRQWVERQIHKADQILHSSRSTDKKIADLKVIERQLKDRGVPNAAKQIQNKINEAKRAQVSATHGATQAIKDKDLSVQNNITVNTAVRVSSRETSKTQTTFKKYFVTAS